MNFRREDNTFYPFHGQNDGAKTAESANTFGKSRYLESNFAFTIGLSSSIKFSTNSILQIDNYDNEQWSFRLFFWNPLTSKNQRNAVIVTKLNFPIQVSSTLPASLHQEKSQ